MCHPAQYPVDRLLAQCEVKRSRASGPGGQHRNKVETAIVVQHLPTGLRGEASERRSQAQNRRQAIARLRLKLALEVRHAPAEVPSELWQQRVHGKRISVSSEHEDFPALLAEALDELAAEEYALTPVAQRLSVTPSQLVKLLKVDPAALVAVNRERESRGEPRLR